MNLQIRFRGKRLDCGAWVYGCYCNHIFHKDGMEYPTISYPNEDVKCNMYIAVDPDSVGMFTGFYDRKGTEIYDGDILKMYCQGRPSICVVGWNGTIGAWCIAIGYTQYAAIGSYPLGKWMEDVYFEIVGNRYDNPELLKNENS